MFGIPLKIVSIGLTIAGAILTLLTASACAISIFRAHCLKKRIGQASLFSAMCTV